jgi:hypothetical protein
VGNLFVVGTIADDIVVDAAWLDAGRIGTSRENGQVPQQPRLVRFGFHLSAWSLGARLASLLVFASLVPPKLSELRQALARHGRIVPAQTTL